MGRQPYKTTRERCEDVLRYIESYFNRHFTSPTYEEIIQATGIKSRGHLAPIINRLIEDGRLERESEVARGLRLPHWSPPSLPSIHLKGQIAANNQNPLVVFDEADSATTVEIPHTLLPRNTRPSELYALTVRGDSMENALIADGDIVILKQGESWKDGDIVAVWLHNDQAVTLKKLFQGRNETVRLKPESHRHQTRVENQADIRVMGRVVAVMRKYDQAQ